MPNNPMHLGLIVMAVEHSPEVEMLSQSFSAYGFQLIVVHDGETAMTRAQEIQPDIMLLDVQLPGIDGFETCFQLKEHENTKDIPVMLMTDQADTSGMAKGFSFGAVDYVTRPFQLEEIVARITTHLKIRNLQVLLEEIIANLQEEVGERKRAEEALQESMKVVQQANDRMKRDLDTAARVQQALLPESVPDIPGVSLAWSYRPCSELGGDSLNVFQLDEHHIGLYVLDVSGHGVSASFLSVTLSRVLIPRRDPSCLFIQPRRTAPTPTLTSPAEVATRLNRMFPMSEDGRQYFTLIYGILDIRSGIFRYMCAGHPPPLYLTPEKRIVTGEVANVPIGLFEDSQYEEGTIRLEPGGRLYLYSDGLLEARNPERDFFGELRLQEILRSTQRDSLQTSVQTTVGAVLKWTEHDHLQDDLSILAVELTS